MEVVIEVVKFSDGCYGAIFSKALSPLEILGILQAAMQAVIEASEVSDNG